MKIWDQKFWKGYANLRPVYKNRFSKYWVWAAELRIRIRRILCFWASWIRICWSSFYHQAKKARKPFIPTILWLLYDFLSLKNDVNVSSKSNKQKNLEEKNCFLLASLRSMTKIAGSGAESIVRGTDPRIRTKMSRIRNTVEQVLDFHRPSKMLCQTSGRQNHWSLTDMLVLLNLCFSVVRLNFWNIPKLWIQLVIPILLILSG